MMHTRRHVQLLAAALFAVVALTACPGSTPYKPPAATKDGGVAVYLDGAGNLSPPAPTADGSAATPNPTPGSLTCAEIDTCAASCSDQTCFNSCLGQGSADGQAKMQALEQCDSQAVQGSCKTQCAAPDSQTCFTCVDQACAAQLQACFGTTTPPTTTTPPATAGTLTCSQIADCYDACTNEACYDTCFYQGSADAQAKMDAVESCWAQAATGSCKSQCTNPQSQTCWDCEDQACAAQETACWGY